MTCPTEHTEAAMLMRACRAAEGRHPELALLYAIPNGGKRNRKTASDLKAEGVKAGVPDYHLPVARGGRIGLWVELKRTQGGRVSPEQRAWLVGSYGYPSRTEWIEDDLLAHARGLAAARQKEAA